MIPGIIIFILGSVDSSDNYKYYTYADSSILVDSVTYFYGNVIFKHKDITIRAEKATLFFTKNEHIDKVEQQAKTTIIAQDSVHIVHNDIEIFSETGKYSLDKNIRLFNGFLALRENEILQGDSGRYYEDTLWMYGNSVYLNNDEEFKVTGNTGIYKFNEKSGIITGQPVFETIKDSIRITGDTIKFFGDTLTKVLKNTTIDIEEMQGFADSIIYFPKKEEAELYGTPFIVSETDSLGGEQIKIIIKERKADLMIVQGKVWGKRWKQ